MKLHPDSHLLSPSLPDPAEELLYEHHRITVDAGQSPIRIDKYLAHRLKSVSRTRIQYASEAGNILADGKSVRSSFRIKPGMTISVMLPFPPHDKEIKPEKIPVDIVHEDQWMLVVNKQAGMVVHPAQGNYSGTLMNALVSYLNPGGIQSENNAGTVWPYLVHRLDKNTSGLMVVAKDERTQALIAKQFFDRTVTKKYIALAWGSIKNDTGVITGNVGRNIRNRKIMDVFNDADKGKPAITEYRVIERMGNVTLVECYPKTGRTHQIRVHLRYLGHPLFNDESYGGDRILKGMVTSAYKKFIEKCFSALKRQALHAATIAFIHPYTREKVSFSSSLPADMEAAIRLWRNSLSA